MDIKTHTLTIWSFKFFSFLQILSTWCRKRLCVCNVLDSSVYCNYKILFVSTCYYHKLMYLGLRAYHVWEFCNCTALILKLHRWFLPLFHHPFLLFKRSESSIKTRRKPAYALFYFYKVVIKPTKHTCSHFRTTPYGDETLRHIIHCYYNNIFDFFDVLWIIANNRGLAAATAL